jgi:hypothetical protein
MTASTLRLPLQAIALAAATLLAACGGGSDGTDTDTSVSAETAESVGANAMVLPDSAAGASTETLKTTQAVVAGGEAGQTYACAGGGTAVFTVTGGSLASLSNGQLDAGEVYAMQFAACRGSAGAASVDGAMTLSVIAASADAVTVDTSTQGIVVALPQRTLTLNGNSTIVQTVVVNGATTVSTTRWTSPQIQLTSVRNARSSSLTLTGIDHTRSLSVTNGLLSATSSSGTVTLAAALPNGAWTASIATQGAVSYDSNGVPTQGAWQITLPHNRLALSVATGTATLTVDHGPDGSIDRTYTFGTVALAAEAL